MGNTASLFDAAEFPQNEEAGESDECEMAEGKAPAGYRPGYPPYGGRYAPTALGVRCEFGFIARPVLRCGR